MLVDFKPNIKVMVLFERHGFEPEVCELVDTDLVQLHDGKRIKVLDSDLCDLISRAAVGWSHDRLIALCKGNEMRTRRVMHRIHDQLIPVKKKKHGATKTQKAKK